MGLFDQLFGRRKQRTMDDVFLEVATPIVVNGYRALPRDAAARPARVYPTLRLLQSTKKAPPHSKMLARPRGEILPADIQNNIVLIFLQKYQTIGRTSPENLRALGEVVESRHLERPLAHAGGDHDDRGGGAIRVVPGPDARRTRERLGVAQVRGVAFGVCPIST